MKTKLLALAALWLISTAALAQDPCPCGSKEKFKKCCGSRLSADDERIQEN